MGGVWGGGGVDERHRGNEFEWGRVLRDRKAHPRRQAWLTSKAHKNHNVQPAYKQHTPG